MATKKILIAAACAATACLGANAATIVSTDFDGGDGLGGVGDVTWSGADSGSASDLTAISPGAGFAVLGGLSTADTIAINSNMNANRTADRGYSFTFTAGDDYDLTNLQVLGGHLSGAGNNQAFTSDLTVTIANGGTVFTETLDDVNYAVGATYLTQDFDLTGTSLTNGTVYTVTVTMHDMVGGGAFAAFDGVTLEGSIVPEPGSLALLGLGGLALLRRRRA